MKIPIESFCDLGVDVRMFDDQTVEDQHWSNRLESGKYDSIQKVEESL